MIPHQAPSRQASAVESAVRLMWTDILHTPPAGPDDDFFDLGGQSLDLVRLLAAVRTGYGVDLPVDELFADDFTVAATARAIERALAASDPAGTEPARMEAVR